MTEATLLVGGRVYTGARWAEALLVEQERIVAVGTESEVRRQAPTGADRIDLSGDLVVPGLADAHLHLGELTREREGVDLRGAGSLAELRRRLREAAAQRPEGALVGRGLDVDALAERRWPSLEELDAAVPNRAVVLQHVSGHAAVVNRSALRLAGTPDHGPTGAGSRTGLFVEEELRTLRPLLEEALPLTPAALERTSRELVGLGLVAVGTMNTHVQELRVLRELDESGRLPLRVRAYPPLGDVLKGGPTTPRAHGRLRVVGVKGFLDGAFGPRTASLAEPYADDRSNAGIERRGDAEMVRAIDEAYASGLTCALHAIGDRAVARACRLLTARRPPSSAARIEHASLTPPALFAPLREARVFAVVQPGFVVSDVWLRDRLGSDRVLWAYPFRSLGDAGIPLAGSSDAPYDPADPWRGIRAAVRRQDELGRSANPWPDQALSEPEAIDLYARGAHEALGDAGRGRLEPGAPAEFLVVAARRLGEVVRLGGAAVRQTWVEGRLALRSGGEPGRRQ
jgi:predicted amidohydrolase YtcJ